MSEDTKKLKELLQKLKLDTLYFEKFQEEHILHSDLGGVLEEDLVAVIPNRIHRRRLFKHLNSMKEEGREKVEDSPRREKGRDGRLDEEKARDEEAVQMLVKWDEQVVEVFDVPLGISNGELIGKLLQKFLTCRIKLQGEERMLVKKSRKFNLKKWFQKSGLSEEDTIRAVLKVEGEVLQGGKAGGELDVEVEELKKENEKLVRAAGNRGQELIKRDDAIKKLEKAVGERDGQLKKELEKRDETIGKLTKENVKKTNEIAELRTALKRQSKEMEKRNKTIEELVKGNDAKESEVTELRTTVRDLRSKLYRAEIESKYLRRDCELFVAENDQSKKEVSELTKEIGVLKKKVKGKEPTRPGRVEMERTTLTPTTATSSGIVCPKIRFLENDRTSGVFSNGNKRATSNKSYGYSVFKGNFVFKVGKKYYFQAKYTKSRYNIGLGVLQGDVKNTMLGYHTKGWECYCHNPQLLSKGSCISTKYGTFRKTSASVGVLVDFTNGKREVSFIFDGKNYGVAFKDVEPPVSPAFYVYGKTGDTWEIEDVKELPEGLKKENKVLKEKVKGKESRPGRVEMEPTVLITTSSGIVIPKIRFVENFRTFGVFSNGNTRATSNKGGHMVFKGNYVFKVGKKYYFQARYKRSDFNIGIGVLRGEVRNTMLGFHPKGWECYCCHPYLYCKGTNTPTNYGSMRKKSASVGVLVDFTNGKREVSFFLDGKNCGVAFKDVEPPVSPAFYVAGDKGDTWEIEDVKQLPKGM